MTEFADHFEELRRRVLRAAIAVAVITAVLITMHVEPYDAGSFTIYYLVPNPLDNVAAQITEHMRDALVPEGVQLIQTSPGQAFFSQVYIAALVGGALAMPAIVREAAGFLGPALRQNEIRISRGITLPAVGLFAAGAVFSYYMVIPYMLDFLYQYGDAAGLITFLNVMDFVSFVLQLVLAFGVSFQLPLAMYALAASGAVGASFWRSNLRYAIVAIVVFGAAITPDGSGVTMWFIAAPMAALYVAGMLAIERRGRKTLKSQGGASGA